MVGKMYYGMPSEEECLQAALTYKQRKDDELFNRFLLRYERLAHYTCWWMQQRNNWLRPVEKKDLDQTSYIGIYKAFITVTPNETPKYLALRVITYVKHELTTTFHYLKDEHSYYQKKGEPAPLEEWTQEDQDMSTAKTYTPSGDVSLDEYKNLPKITEKEGEIIQMIYVEGYTQTEAANRFNVSKQWVHEILKSIHKKIKKVIIK